MGGLKVGKTMARLRQADALGKGPNRAGARHFVASDQSEGEVAVLSRVPGAVFRAALVVLLIVLPIIALPIAGEGGFQLTMFMALLCAVFTIVEYTSNSPSLVEFRSAPPFNRLRFGALFLTVATLSIVFRESSQASTLTMFLQAIGDQIGASIDFPYSPVRLLILSFPKDTDAIVIEHVRTAAGLGYLISLMSLAIFVILLRYRGWPRNAGTFNVWINLPTFDPTAGGDVVDRLNRDSQINLILGFLLPFLAPAVLKLVSTFIGPVMTDNTHALIWAVTAWAFLPASLLMRGVALSRVAQMIYVQRKRAYAKAAAEGMLPV